MAEKLLITYLVLLAGYVKCCCTAVFNFSGPVMLTTEIRKLFQSLMVFGKYEYLQQTVFFPPCYVVVLFQTPRIENFPCLLNTMPWEFASAVPFSRVQRHSGWFKAQWLCRNSPRLRELAPTLTLNSMRDAGCDRYPSDLCVQYFHQHDVSPARPIELRTLTHF